MNIGDVVYLKSGSRPMTVYDFDEDGTVKVVWDGGKGAFPPTCLAVSDPTPVIAKQRREIERANADEEVKVSVSAA